MRLSTALLTLLVPSIAFAQDGETQEFWQVIVSNLTELIAVVVTPLLIVLVRKLVKVTESKTNLDITERQMMLLDEIVRKGVDYAEEQAHKALKSDRPINKDDKKALAVKFISNQLKDSGLVELGADKLSELVESKLGNTRERSK